MLKNLNLTLDAGEVVGLVGSNGSGKTTTIKALMGLIQYTGEIILNGYNTKNNKEKSFQEMMLMPPLGTNYAYFTGYQNLELGNCYYPQKKSKAEIIQVLQQVGLGDSIYKKLSKYSLGMMQRLSFAKIVLYHPQLVLMDEPLNGLALDGVELFTQCIQEFKAKYNMTILLSSHDIDIVQQVCNRVVFIQKGEIKAQIDTNDNKDQFVIFECDGILQYQQEIQTFFEQELTILSPIKNEVGLYTNDIDKLNKFIYNQNLTIKSMRTVSKLKQKYIEFFGGNQ